MLTKTIITSAALAAVLISLSSAAEAKFTNAGNSVGISGVKGINAAPPLSTGGGSTSTPKPTQSVKFTRSNCNDDFFQIKRCHYY